MNYKIIAKYLKFSQFKINNSTNFFNLSEEIKNYKINIDIKSNQIKNKLIEVDTTLSLVSRFNKPSNLESKVTLSTIIEIENVMSDKNKLKEIILINVPEEVYNELREIFLLFFEKSGFKDIKVEEKINFKKLYQDRKNQ